MPTHTDRAPLTIRNGVIDIGVDRTRFEADHAAGLLRNYLLLLRRTRDQRHTASITLRRDDVEVIAQYLDTTPEAVLDRLADLMGSTRTQRAAMLTLFATGAMLVAATGSAAAESPRPLVHKIVSGPSAATVAETSGCITPRRPGWQGGWGGWVVGVGSVMFVPGAPATPSAPSV